MLCHGALVDVHGVGVLLLGPSGIGKSECALELLRRGHRLVADDVVEISRRDDGGVEGRAPERIRHHIEIRGLGILSVPALFGPDSVLDVAPVDLICHLDAPDTERDYERVGIDRPMETLAGARVPSVVLPARIGGSAATVVEVAAREHTQRLQGINAAERLDAREAQFLGELPTLVARLRGDEMDVEILFLESSREVLVNRYRETRRVHPLSPDGSVERGIEAERELLADVARLADHAIDTSQLNVHQLKATVVQLVSGQRRPTVVNLISFGFRYGTPGNAELLFDVRFLPNPYFEEELRDRAGFDRAVSEYVLKNERGGAFFERLRDWFEFLLPLYDAEGKAYVAIGVGCTGGRHRSVAIVEALAEALREKGRELNVEHRDVEKAP